MKTNEAIRVLRRQADRLRSLDVVDSRQPAFGRWFRETKAALDDIFGMATGPNREFQLVIFQPLRPSRIDPDSDWREAYEKGVPVAFSFLDSVIDDLSANTEQAGGTASPEKGVELHAGAAVTPTPRPVPERIAAAPDSACLVFGGDPKTQDEVVGFLQTIGARTVALRAETDGGASLLDRLDEHAAAFAVMLLAADDSGGGRAQVRAGKAPKRPDGNAALALGILLGRLGRNGVCLLHADGAEIPPGSEGVSSVALDAGGNWKFGLARAMKGAGLSVDLNKAAL